MERSDTRSLSGIHVCLCVCVCVCIHLYMCVCVCVCVCVLRENKNREVVLSLCSLPGLCSLTRMCSLLTRMCSLTRYREREGKSREMVLSLTSKLKEAEEALEHAKKRLWVREREAHMLQKQTDNTLARTDSARTDAQNDLASGRRGAAPWSCAPRSEGVDVSELQRRLTATENVLAQRTQRLRDVEELLGVQAESGWAQREGLPPINYAGRQSAPAPAFGSAGGVEGNARRPDPLSEGNAKHLDAGKEDGTWLTTNSTSNSGPRGSGGALTTPAGPTPLPPPQQQGNSEDWLGSWPGDEERLPDTLERHALERQALERHALERHALERHASAAVPAPACSLEKDAAAPAERGVLQGLGSSVATSVTSVSGWTSRRLASLPFLGSGTTFQKYFP